MPASQTSFSKLTGISSLDLEENALTGTIPPSLAKLTGLSALWLHSNELSGVIPLSLSNLQELKRIYLHDNTLNGSFPQSLVGLEGAPGQPQRCKDSQMFRQTSDETLDFGQCRLRPVPSFQAVGSTPSLALQATRARGQNKADAKEVLLIAHDATSQGGIQGAWLKNGLGLPADQLRTKCGKPSQPCTTGCTTIWLEELSKCAVLNESHITVTVKFTDKGFALLNVTAQILALPDGAYDFNIHLPVPYADTGHTASINGTFTVTGDPVCRPGSEHVALGSEGAKQCLDCEAGTIFIPQFSCVCGQFMQHVC